MDSPSSIKPKAVFSPKSASYLLATAKASQRLKEKSQSNLDDIEENSDSDEDNLSIDDLPSPRKETDFGKENGKSQNISGMGDGKLCVAQESTVNFLIRKKLKSISLQPLKANTEKPTLKKSMSESPNSLNKIPKELEDTLSNSPILSEEPSGYITPSMNLDSPPKKKKNNKKVTFAIELEPVGSEELSESKMIHLTQRAEMPMSIRREEKAYGDVTKKIAKLDISEGNSTPLSPVKIKFNAGEKRSFGQDFSLDSPPRNIFRSLDGKIGEISPIKKSSQFVYSEHVIEKNTVKLPAIGASPSKKDVSTKIVSIANFHKVAGLQYSNKKEPIRMIDTYNEPMSERAPSKGYYFNGNRIESLGPLPEAQMKFNSHVVSPRYNYGGSESARSNIEMKNYYNNSNIFVAVPRKTNMSSLTTNPSFVYMY